MRTGLLTAMSRRLRPRGLVVAALVALAVGGALAPRPPAAQAGCITTLPISWSLSSHYAAAWTRRLVVNVHTNGPRITGLAVTLSTFHGDVLGKATLRSALTSNATIRIRLRYPMQSGPFSLYFYGYPNADPSCGPKHDAAVVHFLSCSAPLPVKVLNLTQGPAASYRGTYAFDVRSSTGAILHGLSASLSSFEGVVVGTARIPVLFGEYHVKIPLRQSLHPKPERYTVDVSGFPPGRPRSCGPGQSTHTVTFS